MLVLYYFFHLFSYLGLSNDLLGSEDSLMKQEVREIMNNNDDDKLKATIQELIQTQGFKKVEKELCDWNQEDIEKLDDSITFTFDQEESPNELKLEEVKEADEIEEEEAEESVLINLDDLNDCDSETDDPTNDNEKITLISMEKDFNCKSDIKSVKKKVSKSKNEENQVNNQKNLLSFWKYK